MTFDNKTIRRYRQIHDIFVRRSGSHSLGTKLLELAEEVGVSLRQINEDIKNLREQGAPLEYVRTLRAWRYRAGEDFFIAEDQIFNAEEVASLRITLELVQRMGHDELTPRNLPAVFQKFYKASRKWTIPDAHQKFIYFDPLPRYEGAKHLPFFLKAIEESRRVEFQYLAFHAQMPKTIVFDPWFLRHYDRRWYVGGFSHDPSELFVRVFPLERIHGLPANIGFCHDKPRDYDAASYWKNIYGITVPPNRMVETIRLEFTPIQGKYFTSTPFIEPFVVVESTEKHLVVELNLIINPDLIRKLASFGADVRVVQPQSLVETMKAFYREALERL